METNTFSLSTAWNIDRHTDGREMLGEIVALGFKKVELGFNLTPGHLEGVRDMRHKGEVEISSIHNYCPLPVSLPGDESLPDYFSLSAVDEDRRKTAVTLTRATIDLAAELNCPAVVLHCGRVDAAEGSTPLHNLYKKGQAGSEYYRRVMFNILTERRKKVHPHMEKLMQSLDEICRYAEDKGVKLGAENRYSIREIPSLEEIEILLGKFNLYYWHDVGHAQYFENLGIASHQEYLDRYGDRLLGSHLHDIEGTRDHQVPGQGKLDFKKLCQYLTDNVIKVLEIHPPATGQQVKSAYKYLSALCH